MTVADLIEVLQQCPNPKVPVVVRALQYDKQEGESYSQKCEVDDVRFQGNAVVIDIEQ